MFHTDSHFPKYYKTCHISMKDISGKYRIIYNVRNGQGGADLIENKI